jgi:hypothetical protein
MRTFRLACAASVVTVAFAVADAARAQAGTDCDGCWAVVRANGNLSRGHGVENVQKSTPGLYRISFDRPVNTCGFIVVMGTVGGAHPRLGIATATDWVRPDDNGVAVYTYNAKGDLADRGFHLSINCAGN